MTSARDRADRKGSTPVQIGSLKLDNSSDNLSVTNESGTPKKVIASEVQLGTTANDTVILSRNASTGKLKLQTTSGGGSAEDSSAGGVTVYANISAMTSASASAGDQALVTANSGLYVHNGGGWYKVATINTSPTISSPSTGANNTLATDGTATTIELVQADVDEGTTLQNSYSVTSGSLTNIASVTSSATSSGTYSSLAASTNTTNRFFKITPVTSPTTGGSVSLTFSATDGISAATTVQNFTLTFIPQGSTTFDGSGDGLETESSSTFNMGTGDFTLEWWVYPNNFSATQIMADRRLGGSGNDLVVFLGTDGKVNFNANSGTRITSASAISASAWTHISVVRASGTTKLYIGGTAESTTYSDSNNYTSNQVRLGIFYNNNTQFMLDGKISNYREVKGSVVYSSNFTPPTSPLSAITNTILLTCQNNTGTITDASTNSFTITAIGDAAASASHPF